MKKNINFYFHKISCNYLRQGVTSIAREFFGHNVEFDFNSNLLNEDTIVITKGCFTPFMTQGRKFIVISEKIRINMFLNIISESIRGQISSEVKNIRMGGRELEILSGVFSELNDSDISSLMKIQKKTVSSHKDNIKRKISARSRIDLFYAFSVFNINGIEIKNKPIGIMDNYIEKDTKNYFITECC